MVSDIAIGVGLVFDFRNSHIGRSVANGATLLGSCAALALLGPATHYSRQRTIMSVTAI